MNHDDSRLLGRAIDIAISIGLISLLLVWCFRIVQPFVSVVVWGGVIAVTLAVPVERLARLIGGRQRAIVAFTVLGLAAVMLPAAMLAETLIGGLRSLAVALESGEFAVPAPGDKVRDWPLVGERVHRAWSTIAADTTAWLEANAAQLRALLGGLVGRAGQVGLAVLQFAVSTLVAALMLGHAAHIDAGIRRFFARLLGAARAESLLRLSTATIRSVAVGVLGIAFIQGLAAGVGLAAVGVPAAGLLALLILILAIAQLPPWLVLLPVTVYVFSENSALVASLFAIWSIVVSFADMVLKPLLLGRGVEAPMPVILLGAIGGMLLSGIIGLFVGAVVLALGYTLLESWLAAGDSDETVAGPGPGPGPGVDR